MEGPWCCTVPFPTNSPWSDYAQYVVNSHHRIEWLIWSKMGIDLCMLLVIIGLLVKVWRLANRLKMVADAAEVDRELTHQILVTIKGWALVVEQHDKVKLEKIQEVAETTARTACEVKQAITEAVEATTSKVSDIIDKKASGDSSSAVLGVLEVRKADPHHQ